MTVKIAAVEFMVSTYLNNSSKNKLMLPDGLKGSAIVELKRYLTTKDLFLEYKNRHLGRY